MAANPEATTGPATESATGSTTAPYNAPASGDPAAPANDAMGASTTSDAEPPKHARTGRPDRSARTGTLLTALVGVVLAVGTAVVALAYRWPPVPSDHLNYLDAARDFPLGPWAEPLHQHLRIGLTWPMRAAMMAFDYSEATYYLVPVLATVGLALSTYLLGVLLFSRMVGVGAAILTVGNTVVFDDIAAPLPDLPATALFCWALVLAVAVRQRRRWFAGRRREPAVLLLIGVLLAWSYLTREYIVFCWPLIPLVLARWTGARSTLRRLLPRLLWVAAPMALIWLGESLLNAVVYEDPLARIHAASGHGDVLGEQSYATDYQGHDRWWYFTRFWSILVEMPEGFWLGAAAVITVVGGLTPVRRLRFLLGWALLLFVPLTLLGGVLDPDEPMLRLIKERYWYPILPAFFLAAVASVWLAFGAVLRRIPARVSRAAAAPIAAVCALAMAVVPVSLAQSERADLVMYRANGADQMEQLRSWLADHGDDVDVIRADRRTTRIMQVFATSPFGEEVWGGRVVGWYPQIPPKPGDYALLYSPRTRLCEFCRSEARALLGWPLQPPQTWRLAFGSADRELLLYEVR